MKDLKKLLSEKFGGKSTRTFHYGITGDPDEADDGHTYSPQLINHIGKSHSLAISKKKGAVQKIKAFIERYPDVPSFRNHLSVYYSVTGNNEKAYEINREIANEFPDYFFGKLNLANQFLEEGRLDEIPKIMGENFDLKALYPHREMFHFSEYQSMAYLACRYYLAVENIEAAESYLKTAKEVHKKTGLLNKEILKDMEELIHFHTMQANLKRYNESRKKARIPKDRGYDPTVQTDVAPEFHHPEILELYENDLTIDPAILKEILALPRETLIEDLRKVLTDSIVRYEYFDTFLNEMEDWDETQVTFPLHAIFLLTELRATEALQDVIEFLRQGEDFLDFWLSDHLTETLPYLLYHLVQTQLDLLKSFMLERNCYTYSKSTISRVTEMIANQHPERRAEIMEWYREIFREFLANKNDNDLIDTEVISFMCIECMNLRASELLPELKQLWDMELITEDMVGTWAEVEAEIAMEKEKISYYRDPFDSIFDHYQDILEHWQGYMSEEEREAEHIRTMEKIKALDPELYEKIYGEDDDDYDFSSSETFQRKAPKIGRNDPCHCGSGKKYKKCCMNKDTD